ncbi:zinc ribbon domain-containing protein [Haloarchaeobius sp. DT45]|uniref:zinc ribbon domain-containing protein n=1 Tax=Haloarchaeobius sp. DT45 TaxID=3446116 RepID=UPI003F6C173A
MSRPRDGSSPSTHHHRDSHQQDVETDDPRDDGGCPKCGGCEVRTDLVSTTGSGFARLFDIQTRQFRVVTCTCCGYAEFYDDTETAEAEAVDTFLGTVEAGTG